MNIMQRFKLKGLEKKVKKLHDLREQGGNVDVKQEAKAQIELAKFYDAHSFDKKLPRAIVQAFECYRAAAILGDMEAQYICGQRRLEEGKFWEHWSAGLYGNPIHKKYAALFYEEAFTYLKEAETSGHPLAKRLHGLALINGWGVDKDVEAGFKLVVDSIAAENAWDKVTKIFEELGLNSPEFFSMLMTYKKDKR